MRTMTIRSRPKASENATIDALRGKAQQFAAANLPKAASAAENAGQALSDFALSTSRSLAKTLRTQHKHGKSLRGAVASSRSGSLLRTARRVASHNPALVAAAGFTIAMISYSAWRRRDATAA